MQRATIAAPHHISTRLYRVAFIELREETGLMATNLLPVGELFKGTGYCTQHGYVFLATGLTQGPSDLDHDKMDMLAKEFTSVKSNT